MPVGYTRAGFLLLLSSLLLMLLISALNQTIVGTVLPTMTGELGGALDLFWVVSGFIMAATVAMPVFGSVSDAYGRKGPAIVAIALFVLGSVLAGAAQDMTMLVVGRLVQGVGGGGLMILPFTILADVVAARQRAKYAGLFGTVWAFASVFGPLLGGWFTAVPGWRWSFWVNIPLGVLAAAAVALSLRPTGMRSMARIDYPGILLLAVATIGLVVLSAGAGVEYDAMSPVFLVTAVVTAVAIAGFAVRQLRGRDSVLPMRFFANRDFSIATVAGMLNGGVTMFVVIFYLPVYFQMVKGASAAEAGLMMVPLIGSILIVSTIVGFVVSATGRYKGILVVGAVLILAAVALLASMTSTTPDVLILGYGALLGAGLGTSVQLLVLIVQNAVPHPSVGAATAANNYFRQLGAAIGTAVAGALLAGSFASALLAPHGAASAVPRLTRDLIARLSPEVLAGLDEGLRAVITNAYDEAFGSVLVLMLPLPALALVLLLFLRGTPLATSVRDTPAGG